MEFGEKLQELRKSRSLTQQELAEQLYVSRAAVSKWESGRGCPSIESIKDISRFFDVSIDNLLSGEKLLVLAERENKACRIKICDYIFGAADLFYFFLVLLPLYPHSLDGVVYSVNLLSYTEDAPVKGVLYLTAFVFLIICGAIKIIITKTVTEKSGKAFMCFSLIINILIVILLALSRETYATVLVFSLLTVKAVLFFKRTE